MTEDAQGSHRHQLLGLLFGSEVPEALEGQLLRTSDVATLFQVSERTVSEWAKRGQIPSVRTPGGHRRYPADGIRTLLQAGREGGVERTDRGSSPRASASVTELSQRRPASA
jgi:excisionase family DNA binding protein